MKGEKAEMPNWCEGELTVKGSKAELAKFRDAVTSDQPIKSEPEEVLDRITLKPDIDISYLDANKIIPYPKEYADADKAEHEAARQEQRPFSVTVPDGYNHGGYEWCNRNWGTKWGFCSLTREIRPRSIFYSFQTAWSPPEPLIRKMGEMFPALKFVYLYWECGAGYQGKMVIENGIVVVDESENDYHGNRGG
jgi:hypothetical protein